jgi:hypothetical protein
LPGFFAFGAAAAGSDYPYAFLRLAAVGDRMKRWALVVVMLWTALAPAQTPAKNRWAAWEPFLGTWVGDGNGQPGQGTGEFTLEPELQGGRCWYGTTMPSTPQAKDKPAYRHDDLMVIYPDEKSVRADYWDNEEHVIHYVAEVTTEKLVFLSEEAQAGPRYRLTYVKTGADTLKLTFEIAPPNDRKAFKTYITAEAKRK